MSQRPDVDVFMVFDCDGVLVDSERLVQRVEMQLITELGWPITIDEVRSEHLGRSAAEVMANIERRTGRAIPDDFVRRRDDLLRVSFTTELEAVAGVREALDELVALGYRSCIASSGTHDRMRLTLGRTGLRSRFEGRIFSASEVEKGKPEPDLFLHAARRMGVAPSDCVVVEDSPSGIAAAARAGMRSIGFAADTPVSLLRGADLTIEHMDSLVEAISRLGTT
ncbi:HAD family hydrolase [Agromyces sp. SYSU T00266]|uniref:HAD family hydrolase n=1 Tax=Agromyces zhanjiangensis TaxID=3158562 RepID=UPI003396CE0E